MVKKNENGSSKRMMNKGAWTAEEDQKLAEYVKIHGDKKWRSLPAKAGLNRCGKSCRLRWLNYLRPGIKRGNISEDEEDLIIRLHNLIGNRWSLIAGRLPGRTDNEIKNHWNTHLSKKSLTINELNNKLNQKVESSCDRPSARTGEGPVANRVQLLDPIDKSNGSDGAQMASKMWNGTPEKDFDIGDLFDLSSVTGMVGLPESNHQGTGGIGLQDHYFGGQEIYQNLLTTELQGSYGGYFDQPLACDQLEFDALTRLLEYGNDAFFSFF